MFAESLPSMSCDHPKTTDTEPVVRSVSKKKNSGKVPKKEHKARREKQKRDHLNELFLELGHALELERQSNGKASILCDATKLLRDLITQVEFLRKDNTTLLNESRYVLMEKNELRDERTALEAEVQRLQKELQQRMQSDSMPEWHRRDGVASPSCPQPRSIGIPVQQPQVGTFCVIPVDADFHPHMEAGTKQAPQNNAYKVMRPNARYATASDSWPLELLSRAQRAAHEAQHCSGDSGSTTISREESSVKA